ncbi:MAG: LysR family transcriptional regulator [Burkholderiales bacterium]
MNYKHLHYFWVVAKAGGIVRASERLHLTPQTISGQITLFEDLLGYKLFARVGRRLELADAGRVAMSYADGIFSLGEELTDVLRQKPTGRPRQFRVGICDIVPKSIAFRLLEPALRMADPVHIHCRERKLAGLLADPAVHRLDIVLSDSPMPGNVNVHVGSCVCTSIGNSKSLGRLPRTSCQDSPASSVRNAPAAEMATNIRLGSRGSSRGV